MKRLLFDAAAGAAAGTAATVPMSGVMWAMQQLGFIGKQPPEEVTEAALDAADVDRSEQTENRLTAVNHLLFGAAAGALFGAAHRRLPGTGQHVPAGVVYGLAVWASAYQGWVPALHIMPPADQDQPGRPESMAFAHALFGAVLALLLTRLTRHRRRGDG